MAEDLRSHQHSVLVFPEISLQHQPHLHTRGQPNISVFNETRWLAPPPCWPHGQRLVQLPMRKHQRCTTRQRVADHARHVPQDVCYVAVWRAALQDCLDRACDVSRKDLSRCCLGPALVQLPSQLLPTISAISQDDNASRRLQISGSNQRRRQLSGTSFWRCWRRWERRRWQISV